MDQEITAHEAVEAASSERIAVRFAREWFYLDTAVRHMLSRPRG